MLVQEYGTSANIKSRQTRQSVQTAITSVQARLKLYKKLPTNGLVVFCGNVIENGKERKVLEDFEPFKPINRSQYLCSNRFFTDPLEEVLHDEPTYGFVVMDGNGVLLGTLSGTARKTAAKATVDLPKKHSR